MKNLKLRKFGLLLMLSAAVNLLPTFSIAAFADSEATELTFTDPVASLENIYECDGVEFNDSVIKIKNTSPQEYFKVFLAPYNASAAAPYITYKVSGNIKNFKIGAGSNDSAAYNKFKVRDFTVYVSADNINYKKVDLSMSDTTNPTGFSNTMQYNIITANEDITVGANYLKIVYPTRVETEKLESWLYRYIDSVEITYDYGPSGAYVSGTGVKDSGKSFFTEVYFMNGAPSESMQVEYFTVEGSDVSCVKTEQLEGGSWRLWFDKVFEFDREYKLIISDEFTDNYGFSLIESAKKLSFSFEEPEELVFSTDSPFSASNFSSGDSVGCSLGITYNYSTVSAERNITVVMALYDGGKLRGITSEKKSVVLGDKAQYILTIDVPNDIGSDAYIRTYIISDWQSLELLKADSFELNGN